jgi:DNA-3-methyladenine glycosylase I
MNGSIGMSNCWNTIDALMAAYHDEWGTPVHDDRVLFEFLCLEGMQAGLSWKQILSRRQNFRDAFSNFDPNLVAVYTEKDVIRLLSNPGIIRNKRKIESIINNAGKFIEVQRQHGSFDAYIWDFIKGKPLDSQLNSFKEMPTETAESRIISNELKKRGFNYVGPTICYSFMQAVGMVNDHLVTCPRYQTIKQEQPNR